MPIKPDIKLYLHYHDSLMHLVLSHSSALSKGRIGGVSVFASNAMKKRIWWWLLRAIAYRKRDGQI